jgi:hypothetical protein
LKELMGNHLCCAKPFQTTAVSKVIRWHDGGIEEFKEATKVGELMVDNPQQFVCDFRDLQEGRRIVALPAEEDLSLGGVYVLLPMQKYLRRVLSPSDMTSLNLLSFQCNSGHRKFSFNSRIFPALGTGNSYEFRSKKGSAGRSDQLKEKVADLEVAVPKLEIDENEDQPLVLGFGEHRVRGFRYWKPSLETVKESPRVCKP